MQPSSFPLTHTHAHTHTRTHIYISKVELLVCFFLELRSFWANLFVRQTKTFLQLRPASFFTETMISPKHPPC